MHQAQLQHKLGDQIPTATTPPAPGDKQDTQSTRKGQGQALNHTARLTPNLPALLILKNWRVRPIAYLGMLLLAFQLIYSKGPQYLLLALSLVTHNCIQSKRRLFERRSMYWPRQFHNALPHHFRASFSKLFSKLHQSTRLSDYYCYM